MVEDNVDVAESFVMLLEIQGHEVRAVYTGPAALEVAATFVPDVALIDLGLPGLDGYEVARRLRALPSLQATVLVALSGYGRDEDRRRAQAAGFDHHLTNRWTRVRSTACCWISMAPWENARTSCSSA